MSLDLPAGGFGSLRPSSPFELRHASTHRPLLVIVPERRLLAINGAGPREAADFRLATTILRTVGATVQRMVLRDRGAAPPRSVLEVTWPIEPALTVDEIVEHLSSPTPRWCQMNELPNIATEAMAIEAIDESRRKGGRDLPLVRLTHLTEGPAVQILQLGEADQWSSIRKLYSYVAESGFRARGDLHELVLADRNSVGRERARSILRAPIADG
jgi:hypothetical protein